MASKKKVYKSFLSPVEIYWWALAILFSICLAILSWSGNLYLFTFPEKSLNYKLLSKLGFAGDIQKYTTLDAPSAKPTKAELLYEKFYPVGTKELALFNQTLKRGYITNYSKQPVYRYLTGEYRILESRLLKPDDFIYPGILLKARAFVKPDENEVSSPYPVILEYFIPTTEKTYLESFQAGDLLKLRKTPHCASVIHVEKTGKEDDPTLVCVAVPLAYNDYKTPDLKRLKLQVPSVINPARSFPNTWQKKEAN